MGNLAEQAFRRHYDDVYRFVRRRTASTADAEDIAAEVFADAAKGLDGLELDAKPMLAWLFTVARRRLADEARRRSRSPVVVDEDVEGAREYGPEIADTLRRAIASLPETQRTVLVLKLVEGRRFGEIARRLDITEAACKMRLSRAVETMREELEREGVAP